VDDAIAAARPRNNKETRRDWRGRDGTPLAVWTHDEGANIRPQGTEIEIVSVIYIIVGFQYTLSQMQPRLTGRQLQDFRRLIDPMVSFLYRCRR
jgi:hypothetical protein